jgi:hypothetical membrane protein
MRDPVRASAAAVHDPMRAASSVERALLACGMIGPAFFVTVFLVAGAVRPGYDPLRHPVSSLSIGEAGWIQAANFMITGALVVAFACGLRPVLRRGGAGVWGPLVIGLVGIGLAGAGVFTADPRSGYPAGTSLVPVPTTEGTLHDLFSLLVFLGPPVACCVVARWFAKVGRRGWAASSVAIAVVFLTGFVLAGMGFEQNPALTPIGGLLQRATLVVGLGWLAALALHLLRGGSAGSPVRQ